MSLFPMQPQNLKPAAGLVHRPMMPMKPPMHFDAGGAMSMSMAEPWFARRGDSIEGFNPTSFYSGTTGGRTDNIHNAVPVGSYIMPADVVSGLGEGNSHAGAAVIDKMFHTNPHGIEGSHITGGRGIGIPSAPRPFNENNQPYAKGGNTKDKVHIVTASGEVAVHPDALVAKFGHPKRSYRENLDRAHRIMDDFVTHIRKKTINDMKKLRPPVGSKK